MEEWVEAYSEKHKRKYWKNKTTGETTWKNPVGDAAGAASKPASATKSKSPTPAESDSKETAGTPAVESGADDWVESYSKKHDRKFWKHKVTGETSWKPPTAAVSNSSSKADASLEVKKEADTTASASKSSAVASSSSDWVESYSEKHKRKFWKNKVTGKSSWTKPEESISAAEGKDDASVNTAALSVAASGASAAPAAATSAEDDWVEGYSEKHKRKYWKSKSTGKVSWKPPAEATKASANDADASTVGTTAGVDATAAAVAAADDGEWEERFSEKANRKYWKNKTTGKTSWHAPTATSAAASLTGDTSAINTPAATPVNITSSGDGADQWEESYSEKYKRKCWKNKVTGKTSWTKPTADVVAAAPAAAVTALLSSTPVAAVVESDWKESYSEKHKRKYWKNKVTGKTSWTDPTKTSAASAPPSQQHSPLPSAATSAAPSIAPSAAPSLAPSAAPSAAPSPLTVSSDIAKVENKTTLRSVCFIHSNNGTWSPHGNQQPKSFVEILHGENDSVIRTFQVHNQIMVTDTAESILPSSEHFPEKGCGVLDEWDTNAIEIHPGSQLLLKKQVDVDQGIVTKTNLQLSGHHLLSEVLHKALKSKADLSTGQTDYLKQFGPHFEAYELCRDLGGLIDLESTFAVGDSSSFKLSLPVDCHTDLDTRENAVLFHLTDMKRIHVQMENNLQHQDRSDRDFPMAGILPIKISQQQRASSLSASQQLRRANSSSQSFMARSAAGDNVVARWMPCWIELGVATKVIHFHELGPKTPPTFTLSCEEAKLSLGPMRDGKSFELEIVGCAMTGNNSTASNTVFYNVRINFLVEDEFKSWYYSFALTVFGINANKIKDSFVFNRSSSRSIAIDDFHAPVATGEDTTSNPGPGAFSEKVLELERMCADKELAMTHVRWLDVSSMQLKSVKFQVVNGRLVVVENSKCSKLPLGAILWSLNGISAMDLPSHTVLKFIYDLPKQMMVHMGFVRPLMAQYTADVVFAKPSKGKTAKSFGVSEDSSFAPKKTWSPPTNNNFHGNKQAAGAEEKYPQLSFEDDVDWQQAQLVINGGTLSVKIINSVGETQSLQLSSTTVKVVRSSNPATPSSADPLVSFSHQPNTHNSTKVSSIAAESLWIEVSAPQQRLRIRVTTRRLLQTILRTLLSTLKLYAGATIDLEAVSSLHEQYKRRGQQQKAAGELEKKDVDVSTVSVLLSQSALDVPPLPPLSFNPFDQGSDVIETSFYGATNQVAADDQWSAPGDAHLEPAAKTDESVIEAAESLERFLQDLRLPAQFPTAAIVEKEKRALRANVRKNVQSMAAFLTSQCEATFPASAFTRVSGSFLRDAEMLDEMKEGDTTSGNGDNAFDLQQDNVSSAVAMMGYEEGSSGQNYMDGDDNSGSSNHNASSNNLLNAMGSSGAGGGGANGRRRSINAANATEAMQQKQFNKAARRASARLSISMGEIASAQMFASLGQQQPTPGGGLSSSAFSRSSLKAAGRLSGSERAAVSTLLVHFRANPDDLLSLSQKIVGTQDMLSFAFIVIQRIYSPLSTDQAEIGTLLQVAFHKTDNDLNALSSAAVMAASERVPSFGHESRVIQSFEDFAENLTRHLLQSQTPSSPMRSPAAHQVLQNTPFSLGGNSSHLLQKSGSLSKLSVCLLYEVYCRPEIVVFLEALVPRLSNDLGLSPESGVADICAQIVEPLCSRLFDLVEKKAVPSLLRTVLRAINNHHCNSHMGSYGSSGSSREIHAEDFLSAIITPYACNALIDAQMQRGLNMDTGMQQIVNRVRDLLWASFDHDVGKKLQLSLSDSAALSRSRWLIARALDKMVADDHQFSTLGSVNKPLWTPVARLANLHESNHRSKVLESFMCIKPSELLFLLKIFDLSSMASSLLVSTSRAVSEALSVLQNGDIIGKLSNYALVGSGSSSHHALRKTYIPSALDRDVVYILDLDEHDRDKDPLLDLLDDDDIHASDSRLLLDTAAASNSSTSSAFTSEEDTAAINELNVLNWLLSAARTSLQNVYDRVHKVHSVSTVRELHELHDKLRARVPLIKAVLHDWQSLQFSHEIVANHQAQLSILQDIYNKVKNKKSMDYFKGPPPPSLLGSSGNYMQDSSTSMRFPALISVSRMIYVDHFDLKPPVLTVGEEDKEQLLLRLLHQLVHLEAKLAQQRSNASLSDGITEGTNSRSSTFSPRQRLSHSLSRLGGSGSFETSGQMDAPQQMPSFATRSMNPLWVIMQNVFSHADATD